MLESVKVLQRSKDVLHNFAIPQFRVKMDLVPGLTSYFWFTPTKIGSFDVLCQELCGIAHYLMRGKVVVEPEVDFNKWLNNYPTFAQTLEPPSINIAAGKQHYQTCVACHGVNGRSRDNSSIICFFHMRQNGFCCYKKAFKVDIHHCIPFVFCHFRK